MRFLTTVLALWIGITRAAVAQSSPLPLSRMPLQENRYCNRSCSAGSCSAVCRLPNDCDASCTPRGRPICRCRHGNET